MSINYYHQLLNNYLKFKENIKIVQVGANDGRINDPIYEILMNHKDSTSILLIEPQTEVIEFLTHNYRSHPNFIIANVAVGPEKDLTIYRLKPELWNVFIKRYLQNSPTYRVPTGFTSNVKNHVKNHIKGNLPPSIEESAAIECIKVPSYSLLEIIKNHNFSIKIDLLQIDCEGMDDEVLYCCNLLETQPEIINFEYYHLSSYRFKNLVSFLERLNYSVYCWGKSEAIAINKQSIFFKEFKPIPIYNNIMKNFFNTIKKLLKIFSKFI
jgi:FkbM family methyltransferase